MALKDTLSALKMLILSPSLAPKDIEQRRIFLLKTLPNLTPEEASDLAGVSQEGLSTYTTSIYSGEGELIKKFMPRTFGALKERWEELSSLKFSRQNLTMLIAERFPWHSFETVDLLQNVVNFISQSNVLPPYLVETSRLEVAQFRVRRIKSDISRPLTAERCSSFTVEEFLNLVLSKGQAAEWLLTNYNVESDLAPRKQTLVVCRDSNNRTSTTNLSYELGAFVTNRDKFSIEELAEFFVTSSDPESAFRQLSNEILRLCGLGALCCVSLESAQDAHFYQR